MTSSYILSIDQGTSGTKSVVFDQNGQLIAKASEPLAAVFPHPGFVEQDPIDIYKNVLTSINNCLNNLEELRPGAIFNIQCCGISNQRETFVLWDKKGQPLSNAIVWQCKRSVDICHRLNEEKGLAEKVKKKTGLIIDPYFSATKLLWLVENDEKVQKAIQQGRALFGTIDTWLTFQLTKGRSFATDHTNASRTLLFNLNDLEWDKNLCHRFGLDKLQLPKIFPSSNLFGETDFDGLLPKPIPISGMIGDSHAAAFGEGCFWEGTAKATLGTGCSILWNTGNQPLESQNGMLTTICWSTANRIDYALEGAIVSCGATIEWLKNNLNLFGDSKETAAIAQSIPDNGGVYIIPAFSGLGAPHWQMKRKAAIKGLTFASDKRHIIRAALESIPFQIRDALACMESESKGSLTTLNVDGGISNNEFVMQMLANLLQVTVNNIGIADVSALGAAYMAGLNTGIFKNVTQIAALAKSTKSYHPSDGEQRASVLKNYEGWKSALEMI